MQDTTADPVQFRRLLRTVRVAFATAVAEQELGAADRHAARPARFEALAARTPGAWRFPADGLLSADGLVEATLRRDPRRGPVELVLQAQGAAGLEAYAGTACRLRFRSRALDLPGRFDLAGRAAVPLGGLALEEDDLAGFSVHVEGSR